MSADHPYISQLKSWLEFYRELESKAPLKPVVADVRSYLTKGFLA
jgi:hypothetical protein